MSPAQDCRLPGPSFVTARQRRMTWAQHCWMPASRVSRPSGVRTMSTCGAPAAAGTLSFSSGSPSPSRAAGCGTAPLPRTLHGGGVQHRPVGRRARVSARRRARERDRPAARALQPRQRPLGHRLDDLGVDDLRPPLRHSRRAVQPGPAAAALRRRRRFLPLARLRVPGQALPGMAGLPARLAVLAAIPLRFLPPRPPRLFSPDSLLRGRRPRVRAVRPQPALQLRQPQFQPPLALPRRVKARLQHPDLGVLRPQHLPQPRVRSTQPGGVIRHGLIGHAPRAPTATATDQIDARRTRTLKAESNYLDR
jgi:hypothetical protein